MWQKFDEVQVKIDVLEKKQDEHIVNDVEHASFNDSYFIIISFTGNLLESSNSIQNIATSAIF